MIENMIEERDFLNENLSEQSNETPLVAVVIPTKNRSAAVEQYALSSLQRSSFRDFVCVVWDASDDDSTRSVVESRSWDFGLLYFKAPRVGLSSQRNDATRYILKTYLTMRYVVFMDDDSALSKDALAGVVASFREKDVSIVNIPMKPLVPPSFRSKIIQRFKRLLRMNRHGATSFLYNYGGNEEPRGHNVEWASGGGMAIDVAVFKDCRVFFPEEFQRFGGYALGEDFAFSFFIFKKKRRRVINSLRGYFYHYAVGSARLDIKNMAASKWYNFHLLFEALYDDVKGPRLWSLKIAFKLFMWGAALKLLFRARSCDVRSLLKGIVSAEAALRSYRENGDTRLFEN
ncbi:MAG: glycosyltransferase [Synergistaceae bacterium]|nr:glycosyltransferase [Synergistaceae bacterium]